MKLTSVTSAKTFIAGVLSVLPTSRVALPVVAAASTLAISGCSTQEQKSQTAANEPAKLAKAYDDLITEVAENIDDYKMNKEERSKILECASRVKVAREELYKAFNGNGTTLDQIIEALGSKMATPEQKKAYFNYSETTYIAYLESMGPIYNYFDDARPFKTIDDVILEREVSERISQLCLKLKQNRTIKEQ